jgi:hypothetical protein
VRGPPWLATAAEAAANPHLPATEPDTTARPRAFPCTRFSMTFDSERIGYHFVVNFVPNWLDLIGTTVARARAVGLEVSDSGVEIQPRMQALTFAGTDRRDLRVGGLRFDVLGYHKDLHASVVTSIGLTSRHPTHTFGVSWKGSSTEWKFYALETAIALWLRDGALTLLDWSDDRRTLPEERIVEFDVWKSVEAMASLAMGETPFGLPLTATDSAGAHATYASPSWAPQLDTRAHAEGSTAYASFACSKMRITGRVTLMRKDLGDGPRGDGPEPG